MTMQVGQKLWYVPNQNSGGGDPRELSIVKIGRKWAILDNSTFRPYRIDVETLRIDGGEYGYRGQCYIDRAAYESEQLVWKTWREFHRRLSHDPPAGVTTEEIIALAAKWGIPMEGKP